MADVNTVVREVFFRSVSKVGRVFVLFGGLGLVNLENVEQELQSEG